MSESHNFDIKPLESIPVQCRDGYFICNGNGGDHGVEHACIVAALLSASQEVAVIAAHSGPNGRMRLEN